MLKRHITTIMIGLLAVCQANAQTTRAYVQTDAVKIAGITTDAGVNALTIGQKQTSRTYFDGFGRPIQSVTVQGSPGHKDMIMPVAYDTLGRQSFGYLPFAGRGADTAGAYLSEALSRQHAFYNGGMNSAIARDTSPYSHQLFENSPLQRVLQAGSVGTGFQPGQHYKSMAYGSNVLSDSVRVWLPDGSSNAIYAAGELTYAKATDEQGATTTLFTDNLGRTVLKRQLAPSAGRLDTYYIYNNNGSVAYAVPPKAVAIMKAASTYNITLSGVDALLFKYAYDSRARLTVKTVPSAGDMYVVYDPLERPVLMQDASLRAANQWNYIKYDSKGRAISQGIYTDATHTSLSSMQSYVDGLDYSTYYVELRSTSGTYGYYTNNVFPASAITPLAYSYYDDYHISNGTAADYFYSAQGLSGEANADTLVRGMLTAVRKTTIGTGVAATWLTSVYFYDSRGRGIQVQSNNHLYATLADKATTVTDFTGKPLITKVIKNSSGSSSITVQTAYTYDSGDRLTAVDQSYNGGTAKRLADYQYNELGQLIKKNLGRLNSGTGYPYDVTLNSTISTTTNTIAQNQITLTNGFHATATTAPLTYTAKIKTDYLQAIDYRYTIRGQLLSMNNATLSVDTANNADANDVFGMEMLYDHSDGGIGNTAYYNGNLSAVKWMNKTATGSKTAEKSYKYGYDILNRYTDAWYQEKVGGTWNGNGAYNEQGIGYDPNGNILTLKRNGVISNVVARIDSLNYSYDGNRLANVTDGTGSQYTQNGFKNLAAYSGSTPYAYDDNGNLTADLKKGISNHYNILNRVDSIRVTAGTNQWISYTYDATGALIRKVQYHTSSTVPVMTTDYIDGFVYENGTLAYFATNEGRVRNNGGTLTNEYVITDQQGNARVSFEDNGSGRAVVRQENGYYPFGLIMSSGIAPTTQPNKKLYNGGSEWQNDYVDLPDYYQTFFRNYDQALGRWVGIDPQAQSAESMSVYQYAGNNPVMLNDPLGDKVNPDYVPAPPGWEDPHGLFATLRDFDEADARLAALMHGSGGGDGRGGGVSITAHGAIHITDKELIRAMVDALAGRSDGFQLNINTSTDKWISYFLYNQSGSDIPLVGGVSGAGSGYDVRSTGIGKNANQGGSSWLSNALGWMGSHFYTEVSGRLTQGAIGVMSGRFAGSEIDLGKHNLATWTTGTDKGGINAYKDDGTKIYGGQLVVPVFDVPVGIGATHDAKSGQNSGILGIGIFGYERNGNSNFIGIDMTSGVNFYFLGIESTAKIGFKW